MPFWLVDGNLRTLYFSHWLWRCFWSRSPWIVLLATPTRLAHTTTVFKHKCMYVHPDTQIAGSWARVWQPSLGITAESSRVVQWKWAARIHRTQSVGRRLVWPTPPCPLRSPRKRCIRQQFSIICVALLGGCPDGFVFCIFVVAAAVYAN